MMMKRKHMMITALILLLVVILGGCIKNKSDVRTDHGEDYHDQRESKWTFRDSNDNAIAKIRAKKGYVLSNQSYFTCNIEKTEENGETLVAKVDAEAGINREAAINLIRSTNDSGKVNVKDEKDYSRVSVTEEGKEDKTYLILSNKKNSVIILLMENDKDCGSDMEAEIVDMITF